MIRRYKPEDHHISDAMAWTMYLLDITVEVGYGKMVEEVETIDIDCEIIEPKQITDGTNTNNSIS